jgi:hypothetical protein
VVAFIPSEIFLGCVRPLVLLSPLLPLKVSIALDWHNDGNQRYGMLGRLAVSHFRSIV